MFLYFAIHGGDQFLLVPMKNGPPLIFGLQVDEIFRVAESSRVGSIVRRPGLRDDLSDLGERCEDIAVLLGKARAFRLAYAVGHRAARPNGAFVQMWQELRANDTAERQENSGGQRSQSNADYNHAVFDSPARADPVAFGEKNQNRIVPFLHVFPEEDGAQYRRDQDRKRHSAK